MLGSNQEQHQCNHGLEAGSLIVYLAQGDTTRSRTHTHTHADMQADWRTNPRLQEGVMLVVAIENRKLGRPRRLPLSYCA